MTLENLLNTLIQRGRKPFGEYDNLMTYWQDNWRKVFWFWVLWEVEYSLRELVSKESWLWQFVCENGMVNQCKMDWIKNLEIWSDKMEVEINYWSSDYETWIIESALKDESKIEDFLLNSIKLD